QNRLEPRQEAERTRGDEQVQHGIGTGRVIARQRDRLDEQGPERKADVYRPARWAGAAGRWRQRGHKKARSGCPGTSSAAAAPGEIPQIGVVEVPGSDACARAAAAFAGREA